MELFKTAAAPDPIVAAAGNCCSNLLSPHRIVERRIQVVEEEKNDV